MLKIKLIVLGKLKEKYWREAEEEYLKRLGPYARMEIVELKEEAFGSLGDKEKVLRREAEKILSAISREQNVILLHENGTPHTSVEFSAVLRKADAGETLVFVIGGPLGLDPALLKKYRQMSLSHFTFTHQMARVILLEQIYRAATIIKEKQYHY